MPVNEFSCASHCFRNSLMSRAEFCQKIS
uniref:Uncharacterized protein n=1 Tax=Lepeophtheirus salmonis TaxID=72036 RepID=A0A0K2V3F6_LEPSM